MKHTLYFTTVSVIEGRLLPWDVRT